MDSKNGTMGGEVNLRRYDIDIGEGYEMIRDERTDDRWRGWRVENCDHHDVQRNEGEGIPVSMLRKKRRRGLKSGGGGGENAGFGNRA